MPDLVDSLSHDLQDQHLDDGVEFIVFFNTTLFTFQLFLISVFNCIRVFLLAVECTQDAD